MEKQDQPPDSGSKADAELNSVLLPDVLPAADKDEYEMFGLWMNVQLSQLVARWSHLAAPNAARVGEKKTDFGRRFSKPRKAK